MSLSVDLREWLSALHFEMRGLHPLFEDFQVYYWPHFSILFSVFTVYQGGFSRKNHTYMHSSSQSPPVQTRMLVVPSFSTEQLAPIQEEITLLLEKGAISIVGKFPGHVGFKFCSLLILLPLTLTTPYTKQFLQLQQLGVAAGWLLNIIIKFCTHILR